MARTLTDFATQLDRNPVIDIRSTGCKCDGTTDDTANFQAAINQAGITTPTGSATIQVPRGRVLTSTAIRMPRAGITIQGFGMMGNGGETGYGGSDPICSTIVATNGHAHDNTPMLSMDPAFYQNPGPQFLRGSCLRNISFDVSGSSRFTSGAPPVVLDIVEVSNCPEFENVMVFGSIGTLMYVRPNNTFTGNPISENLVFRNCYFFGGYSGNSTQQQANAVIVQASDNIRFEGGFFSYAGPVTVHDDYTDLCGLQIIPGTTSSGGGINNINNGITVRGTAFTNFPVAIRLSNIDISGTCWCPHLVRLYDILIENYNKGIAINQEPSSFTPGSSRSYVHIRGLLQAGTTFGANVKLILASRMIGGIIEALFISSTGDLSLDSTCTGVEYHVGANPNTGTLFDATDTGTNDGHYQKNGLPGRIFTGQTRFAGSVNAPSVATSPPAGQDIPINAMGVGVKISDPPTGNLFLGATGNTTAGQAGTFVPYRDPGTGFWYLAFCVQSGAAGTALWYRVQITFW